MLVKEPGHHATAGCDRRSIDLLAPPCLVCGSGGDAVVYRCRFAVRLPPLAIVAASFALVAPRARAAEAPSPPPAAVDVWLTARDTGDRLALKPPATFEPLEQPVEDAPTVMIDPTKRFQTIEGFGGALTDAAAETWAKLPPERQQEVLTAYFDPDEGIGYSLCRTHIHSCDFSSESYAYTEVPGDVELAHFSLDHDRRFRLPFIRAALETAGAPVKIFASPWSPPAWMKTNGSMLHGGKLRTEYRDAWARYFVRFVEGYEKEGVPIWGLTVQNEPMAAQTWESCIFTAAEERDFVRDHLGPALERAGLSRLKLMIWDHNRGIMFQRTQVVYDDAEAARYVWERASTGTSATTSTTCGSSTTPGPRRRSSSPKGPPRASTRRHSGTGSGARSTHGRCSTTSTTGPPAGRTGTFSSTSGAAPTTWATSASPPCTATPGRAS